MCSIEGNIVDVLRKKIIQGKLYISESKIEKIVPCGTSSNQFILPGLIDSHIHIESSMLIPSEFAKAAVRHGTVATVSDPHEIANVLGLKGIDYMIENGEKVPFKFFWGAPSCVPATSCETTGSELNCSDIEKLLQRNDIYYLSEVMNYPGVIDQDKEVICKINQAKKTGKPIDGHAPGLSGDNLKNYVAAGIKTDHECFTKDEALEKIKQGIIVQIREGSAAKNFETLHTLIDKFPDQVMLCSDDLHPDDLISGHLNLLLRKGISKGVDLFNLLRTITYNPIKHYNLNVGLLQEGDPADFIVVDNLTDFNLKETYIEGKLVFSNGESKIEYNEIKSINKFNCDKISISDLEVKAKPNKRINVIEVIDKELLTKKTIWDAPIHDGNIISNVEEDILKIVVINRYIPSDIQIGFIKNFGLKRGAIGSSIAHDSHNIIAVGCSDYAIAEVVNRIIQTKGGIAIFDANKIDNLELEIGGIMSLKKIDIVAQKYKQLHLKAKDLGSPLTAPFMTLSFMALLVIPSLKIGDKGLFDGDNFCFTQLFTD